MPPPRHPPLCDGGIKTTNNNKNKKIKKIEIKHDHVNILEGIILILTLKAPSKICSRRHLFLFF